MKKKIFWWSLGLFALFMLIVYPQESAAAVLWALGRLREAAESIITFIKSLFGQM